jgi:hypothetical protein
MKLINFENLDAEVWGPHYWFVLHTITICYPLKPNETVKKRYYNFINLLPMLIPNEEMGKNLSKLLDAYPVLPYLDSRESFTKWMHFIHNKINKDLDKPQMLYSDAIINYYKNYEPKPKVKKEEFKWREKIIFLSLLVVLIIIIVILATRE